MAGALAGGLACLLAYDAPAGDAQFYEVTKGAFLVQTSAALPALQSNAPFALLAAAEKCSSIGLTNAALRLPGGTTVPLQTNRNGFTLVAAYASQALLDAAYPDGTYTLTMQTMSDGAKAAPLVVVSNGVPSPHVGNWAAAQTINADADFLLQWDPFTNGTAADWIKLTVRDYASDVVFETANPLSPGQAGLLNGTNSGVVIPRETLIPGRTYSAELMFAKVDANAASYPGVVGIGATFQSTTFTLRTVDVRNYGILKGQLFNQTGPSTLVSLGYFFDTFVNSSIFVFGVSNASFRQPGAAWELLPPPDFYNEEGPYASASVLNANHPNGTYFQAIQTIHDGTVPPLSFSLTGDAYPATTPQISNFVALQTFNAGADFTLTWAPLGGGSNDFVHVEILNASTNLTLWETPEEGEPGALNGTNTSVVIPAETLSAGSNYLLYLTYEKSTLNTTYYPGATGVAGYYKQTLCAFRSIDISGFVIMKGQVYLQTNSGPPALQHYEFHAAVDVEEGTTNLNSATLQLPSGGRSYSLNVSNHFEVAEVFSDKALLDGQFAPGNYVLSHFTVHDGVKVVTNLLGSDNYPAAAPQIANYAAAQAINGGADFTLAWLPLNSSTNQFVWVVVDEVSSGETVFSSPWLGTEGALNGTHASVVIPGGTLRAGYSYQVTVMHAALALDNSSYAGALGLTGYNKQTQFLLTVPGTPFPKTVHILGLSNGQLQLEAVGEPGRTNILEAAASLATPAWVPMTTNLGTFTFGDPLLLPARYYRLREATVAGP